MRQYILILTIISVLVISACAQQTLTTTLPPPDQPGVEVVEVEEPSIDVDNQELEENEVLIGDVYLDKPGYVVIHKVVDGKPATVVGNSGLLEGEVNDVKVIISDYENEKELIAMLHYDDGDGSYEFPGDDIPVTVNNEIVLQKFALIGQPEETVAIEIPEEEDVPPETLEETGPNVVEIDMIARQFDFEPSAITVKKGDNVVLRIKSVDVSHGIAIPEFGVNQFLAPNKEETVEFIADKTGEFTFFCNVFCGSGHRNMRGTLVVE